MRKPTERRIRKLAAVCLAGLMMLSASAAVGETAEKTGTEQGVSQTENQLAEATGASAAPADEELNADVSVTETPEMVQYGYMRSNAVPYESEGLEISKIESTGRILTLTVTNRTETPCRTASFSCLCKDGNGNIVAETSFLLQGMNPGETCRSTQTMPKGTLETVFLQGKLYPGDVFATDMPRKQRSGYETNELPYTAGGLTVIKLERLAASVNLTIRNDSGNAVLGTSYLNYRCYDAKGVVTNSGKCYVDTMQAGDQCRAYFEADKDAVLILLGNAVVSLP